jgi:hypothetical protein|tara:strand:+ start:140 stop:373 length:234 start_codon:yes stop_codon:yes gene_type:complete
MLKKCKCGKGKISCDGFNVYYSKDNNNFKFHSVYFNHTEKELTDSLKTLKKLNKLNYAYKQFKNHDPKGFEFKYATK